MANPHRGEVSLLAGGKTYTLAYTINAVCELEAMLGRSLPEIVADMSHMNVLRAVLWAGLRRHHKNLTVEDAGDLMDVAGVHEVVAAVKEAVTQAFPTPQGQQRKNR